MNKQKLQRKILDNIKINKLTGCWIWQLSCHHTGYGQFLFKGKKKSAHRMAYQSFLGDIPEGMYVLHACDNRRCCNPFHLWLGTRADNNKDRHRKGRSGSHKGEANGAAKLTEEQVIAILASDELHRIIAKQYNVSKQAIGKIKAGRTWSHLKE